MWKDPSLLHGFDRAVAAFHTNGNYAFCFSVTGERLPIFRSHCQVVHSCISLHACVWGTGNGCWQHNGSVRMQYKSLIMPESWTAALKSTHHSAGSILAESLDPVRCFGYILGISFVYFLLKVYKRKLSIEALNKCKRNGGISINEIKYHFTEIIFHPWHPKCAVSSFLNPFLPFSITKQIKTTVIQRHESHMSQVIS